MAACENVQRGVKSHNNILQSSMTTEISELKSRIEELNSEVQEKERNKSSFEQEKVSLEMRLAEVEEQKEGNNRKLYPFFPLLR